MIASSIEWCELGCEEAQLDVYLNECRNACNIKENQRQKDKMQEYLKCMWKKCLHNGKGPDYHSDDKWLECAVICKRSRFLDAHQATEKPVTHIRFLSDTQFENLKI